MEKMVKKKGSIRNLLPVKTSVTTGLIILLLLG
jgi:hypothetical protein